jgi:endogenous inhibitor of DNA gyrase (YacG/DUF329 family)
MSDQKAEGRCPTCRKPTVPQHRPFCSKRCADIDLARWLGGTFVIPGAASDVADDTAMAPRERGSGDGRGSDADDD